MRAPWPGTVHVPTCSAALLPLLLLPLLELPLLELLLLVLDGDATHGTHAFARNYCGHCVLGYPPE